MIRLAASVGAKQVDQIWIQAGCVISSSNMDDS